MFPNPKQKEKANRVSEYRMKYSTCRDVFNSMEEMLKCRELGNLKKLIKIAEHELGIHHQIKSEKAMPRKKEFAIEICNLIGMAHLDKLKIPQNYADLSGLEVLAKLFNVSIANKNAVVPYVFGDQNTYRDPAEPNTSFLVFKQHVDRLEKRLKNSSMAIEKCYLLHEMGKQNLSQNKYDETRMFARKVIDESHAARSYLWEFLGHVLNLRADVKQKFFIKINDSLKTVKEMVDNDIGMLLDPDLKEAISMALEASEFAISLKV